MFLFIFTQRRLQMKQFLSSFPWVRRFAVGFAIVGVALVLLVPLAACGGSSSSGSTASGPVNLTIWTWVPNGLDKSAALYTQTHPNIHITVENVGAGPV